MAQIYVVISCIDKLLKDPDSLTNVTERGMREVLTTLEATRLAGQGHGYFLLKDDLRNFIPVISAVASSGNKELAIQFKLLYILVLAAVKTAHLHVTGKGSCPPGV